MVFSPQLLLGEVLGSESLLLCFFFSSFLGVVLGQERFFPPRFSTSDSKTVQRSALCRSLRELSNEHLLANFGFDTAEKELPEV